jgi:hypothetical protein
MKNSARKGLAWAGLLFILVGLAPKLSAEPLLGQGQSATLLTNDDVMKMVQAKLADAIVTAKIKSSACKFDTSTDALIKLKQAGVSDAVLAAMAEGGAPPAAAGTPPPPPDPNDPKSPHDSGIYYLRQDSGGRQMVLLEPSVYSGGKTGGMFKMAMTYGMSKAKWKAVVKGPHASLRVTEKHPTFYFYFEEKAGGLSQAGGMNGGASSPNEFLLARMDVKSAERELVIGQVGMFGTSSGARSKDIVSVDVQKERPGVYKVQPQGDMEPGEYGFYYGGSTQAMGATGGKLFDFGINPAE